MQSGFTRRFVFALFTMMLGTVVALVIAEIGMRVLFRGMPPSLFAHRNFLVPSSSQEAVYEYLPGARFGDGLYTINSWGFRDREYALEKPPGTYRVVCLGDSYTFGQGVAIEDTWERQLEGRLNDALAPLRVEVMNFGVQAYNSRNELGMLESKALRFDPDLVLLAHLMNDDTWDFLRVTRGEVHFYFEADPDDRIPLPIVAKDFLYRRSLLYRYFSVRYLELYRDEIVAEQGEAQAEFGRAAQAVADGRKPDSRIPLQKGGGIDERSIREMARLCRLRRIPFVILDFSVTPATTVGGKDPIQEGISGRLRDLAHELDVAYVDLFPVLRGRDGGRLRVTPQDHHPNSRLCGFYAEYLAPRLLEVIGRSRSD